MWGVGIAPLMMAAAFFSVVLIAKLNIGVRHILTIYPLMAIYCGGVLGEFIGRTYSGRKTVCSFAVILVGWLGLESAAISPNYISYFNQFAGGARGGARYLGDSNLDWGQDLKELKRVLDELGIEEVILSYLGNTYPAFYGIRYQYLPPMYYHHHFDYTVDSRREVLAISVNNLQGLTLSPDDPFLWLKGRVPMARAGYSVYLYDITGDVEAHCRLAQIYEMAERPVLKAKELEKVKRLGSPAKCEELKAFSPANGTHGTRRGFFETSMSSRPEGEISFK